MSNGIWKSVAQILVICCVAITQRDCGKARATDPNEPLRFRRLFIPVGQETRLVPSNYKECYIVELEAEIARRHAAIQSPDVALDTAMYIVRFDAQTHALVCDEAALTFDGTAGFPRQVPLGRTNVAVLESPGNEANQANSLLSGSQGNLTARLHSDDEIRWGWSAAGQFGFDGSHIYDLQLPVAKIATMWLRLPTGLSVASAVSPVQMFDKLPEQVNRSAIKVPPDETNSSWWRVDFGGIHQLGLSIASEPDEQHPRVTIVRRASTDYELQPIGLNWTTRYSIDLTGRSTLPAFGVTGDGRVTSVTVDSEPVQWSEVRQDDQLILQLAPPRTDRVPDNRAAVVKLTGVAPVGSLQELVLPWIRPVRTRLLAADPNVKLQILAPGLIVWEKSSGKSSWLLQDRANDSSSLQWIGPHQSVPPTLQTIAPEQGIRGATLTGVSIERGRLQAKWTALLDLTLLRPRQLKLRCAAGWDIESVSGPQGSVPRADSSNGRTYSLWLEPDSMSRNQPLRLQVLASRPLGPNPRTSLTIPPGAIAEIDDARVDEAVFVLSPADREVQLSIDARRRQVANLESLAINASLTAEVPKGALLFTGFGGVPAIDLRPRLTAFDAECLTLVSSDSNDLLQWESEFQCTPRGGELAEIKVRIQPACAQTIAWQLQLTTNDVHSLVAADREDTDLYSDWTIRLGASRGTLFKLIGKLQVPADQPVPLASVLGAADQSTEVRIAADTKVDSLSDDLVLLPLPANVVESARMRYPIDRAARLMVSARRSAPHRSIVCWRWNVLSEVGDSGRVAITCEAQLSGTGEFELAIPSGLRLVSAILDDTPLRSEQVRLSTNGFTAHVDCLAPAKLELTWLRDGSDRSIWLYESLEFVPKIIPAVREISMKVNADVWTFPLVGDTQKRMLIIASSTGIVWSFVISLILVTLAWSWWRTYIDGLSCVAVFGLAVASLMIQSPLRELSVLLSCSLAFGRALRSVYVSRNLLLVAPTKNELRTKQQNGSTRLIAESSARLLLVVLIFCGLFILAASWGFSQDNVSVPIPEVIILVDEAHNPVGDVAYIPESLDRQLRSSSKNDPVAANFLSATYSLNLIRSMPLIGGEGIALEARWDLLVEDEKSEVLLTIPPDSIQFLELNNNSFAKRLWRKTPAGMPPGVLIQPGQAGVVRLRATLFCDVHIKGNTASIDASVPQVANSQLKVLYDVSTMAPEISGALGRTEVNSVAREVNSDLGAVATIAVRWQLSSSTPIVGQQQLESRWWLHFGTDSVAAELEFDRSHLAGPLRMLIDQNQKPSSTNDRWQIRSTELLEGDRLQLQITPLGDAPGPLRLFWQLPFSVGVDRSIRLPMIQVDDGSLGTKCLVGIDAPTHWKIEPKTVAVETVTTDTLLNNWQGRRGTISAVYRMETSPGPLFGVLPPQPVFAEARAYHRLQVVAPNELRLRYRLDLTGNDTQPIRLELPKNLLVDRFEVNGINRDQVPTLVDKRGTLVVMPSDKDAARRISLVGRMPRIARFRPPHIQLAGRPTVESIYEIVNDPGMRLSIEGNDGLTTLPFEFTSGQQLAEMLVPFRRWRLDDASHNGLNLPFFIVAESILFQGKADLLTTVRWNDGVWTGETSVTTERDSSEANFLSLEMPVSWSESLVVEPPMAMAVLPPENGFRLIHLLPPTKNTPDVKTTVVNSNQNKEGPFQFTLRYQFSVASRGRIDAPVVRLLGRGTRSYQFVLPGKLTNQSVDWQRSGMRLLEASPESLGVMSPPPEAIVLVPEATERPFTATPIIRDRRETNVPRSTLREAWIIENAPGRNLLVRWDLYPGAMKTAKIMIPAGALLLNVSSCGRSTRYDLVDGQLNVHLNVHQLFQPLELLLAFPEAKQFELPSLADVDVDQSLVHFTGSNSRPLESIELLKPWKSPTMDLAELRRQAVVNGLKMSLDSVADRPQSEIRSWLQMWLPKVVVSLPSATGSTALSESLKGISLPAEISNYLAGVSVETMTKDEFDPALAFLRDNRWLDLQSSWSAGQPRFAQASIPLPQWRFSQTIIPIAIFAAIFIGYLGLRFMFAKNRASPKPRLPATLPMAAMGVIILPVLPVVALLVFVVMIFMAWYDHQQKRRLIRGYS